MPSKNVVRQYVENGYYHVYNRGVEKHRIFEDHDDYKKFLYYISIYLSPADILHTQEPLLRANLVKNNLSGEAQLLAYCLMPNHFHLLLKQNTKEATTRLMRQLINAYTLCFNRRHNRVGSLFQGVFKAIRVENEQYLLQLSKYIHQDPLQINASLEDFTWSSYKNYLNEPSPEWLKAQEILSYFNEEKPQLSYKKFVEDELNYPTEVKSLFLE